MKNFARTRSKPLTLSKIVLVYMGINIVDILEIFCVCVNKEWNLHSHDCNASWML